MSDRSLDEFASTTGSDEAGDVERVADESVDDADTDAADPSVPTMRWSPDGAACDACGAVVSRRWCDGEAFVCADCKAW